MIQLRQAIEMRQWGETQGLFDRLGSALFETSWQPLPQQIYLLAHGPLLGIPLDALSYRGRPMLDHAAVVHVTRMPWVTHQIKNVFQTPESVFLAGDPQEFRAEFANAIETSAELEAVRERFVGPGLTLIQGNALLKDEFLVSAFGRAELVHLAMPGGIDLGGSHHSYLELSEPGRGMGKAELTAKELVKIPIRARLVVLSNTEFHGNGIALQNDLGVISSLLAAGAEAVIATLWSVDSQTRAAFASIFYDKLQNSNDVATALYETKHALRAAGASPDWAAFQLFVN